MSEFLKENYPAHPEVDLSKAAADSIKEIRKALRNPNEVDEYLDRMYAIHDEKLGAYLQPFFARTDGIAIRMMEQAVNDPQQNFNKWPKDYRLYRIGFWSEQTGAIKPTVPELVIECYELVKVEE